MKSSPVISALGVVAIGLLLRIAPAQAQAPGPGSGGPSPTPPDPTSVPIDGGASLLLAGGVAMGLKKLRDRRRVR